jgi:hypothetical protein
VALRGRNNRPKTIPQRKLDNENMIISQTIWGIHLTRVASFNILS